MSPCFSCGWRRINYFVRNGVFKTAILEFEFPEREKFNLRKLWSIKLEKKWGTKNVNT